MTAREAIAAVFAECPNPYAKSYAAPTAVAEAELRFGDEGLKTQVLYILCNTGHWCGPRAKEVKSALRTYINRRYTVPQKTLKEKEEVEKNDTNTC